MNMENGRKKLRICLIGIIVVAIATGALYYCFGGGSDENTEGILVRKGWVTEYGI